jgi:hypothetical protein
MVRHLSRRTAVGEAELKEDFVELASRWRDALCRRPANYRYAAIASCVVEGRK